MRHVYRLIILLSFSIPIHGQIVFQEDFDNVSGSNNEGGAGTYKFPSGWMLVNVDNLTPQGSVLYINEAWERREDFRSNPVDSCAFSTSWYAPGGTADDWMWTPLIENLPEDSYLTWKAVTYDTSYRDGYEVRIMTIKPTGTTGNIGNMLTSSTLLFSTTAEITKWTEHKVNLDSYAGESIYIGFRNNSTDKYLLLIDDIVINSLISDIQVITTTAGEYTQVPVTLAENVIKPEADLKNTGDYILHDVAMQVEITDPDQNVIYTDTSDYVSSVEPGETIHITLPAFTPNAAGKYLVQYTGFMAEADDFPQNNTVSFYPLEITDTVYARDNNVNISSLGIGAGNGGYMGQDFEITKKEKLSSISIYYTRGYNMEKLAAAVWSMKEGLPDTIIATTDTLTYIDNNARLYTIDISTPPGYVELIPGNYLVTAIEFDSTLAVGQTADIFTAGHHWVNWPTSPMGGWANIEDFGANFSKPFQIRMNFFKPCTSLDVAINATDASCENCSDGSLSAVVTGGAEPYQYLWSNNDITVTSENLVSGIYSVIVTDNNGCILTKESTVNYDTCGILQVTVIALDATCISCNDGSLTAVATGGAEPYQYLWTNNDITPTSGNLAPGSYSVMITDNNGCILSDTGSVSVNTSVSENNFDNSDNLEVFPVPANKVLYIKQNSHHGIVRKIDIADAKGKLIISVQNPEYSDHDTIVIDISVLPSGLYIGQLFYPNHNKKNFKFIK
ncbi:MAG TPA: choice-of-anchor J domain-containing protein [Bacteroidales bacterium]|jgi:hypothetical protein|nr:choice-of-anchor J domain-containing protein [Bacteroidales bacterium]